MKQTARIKNLTATVVALGWACLAATSSAQIAQPGDGIGRQSDRSDLSSKMDLQPRLGNTMPKGVNLLDEEGKQVKFGDFIGEKPVIFLPIFYRCNGVCEQEVYGLVKTLVKETNMRPDQAPDKVIPGRDATIVVVSIHPKETPALARAERKKVMDIFELGWSKLNPVDHERVSATVNKGWKFLVGDANEVKKLTDAIGFTYTYDEKLDWVFHPSALVFLTKDGQISSYITGVNYASKLLRANVDRAVNNEVGPRGETYLLGCFMNDPATGRTTIIVENVLKVAGILTVFIVALSIFLMTKSDKNRLPTGGTAA